MRLQIIILTTRWGGGPSRISVQEGVYIFFRFHKLGFKIILFVFLPGGAGVYGRCDAHFPD